MRAQASKDLYAPRVSDFSHSGKVTVKQVASSVKVTKYFFPPLLVMGDGPHKSVCI